ncbi:hypothetical protein HWV62_45753 [Athelia sp. TMB]|nr:hypothetical protein HWV62_45753 [Athelia sp. TMB]
MPTLHLLAAGSNATNQLALAPPHPPNEDAHTLTPASFLGTPPGELPEGTTRVLDIRAGAGHTLALLERAGGTEVWACGDAARGQLGNIDIDAEGAGAQFRPLALAGTPTHIAAAWATSYVVLSDDSAGDVVLAFGADDFGLLGGAGPDGTVSLAHLALPPLRVTALAAGPHHVVLSAHTLTVPKEEVLIGWGAARHGQLGAPPAPSTAPRILALPTPTPAAGLALGAQHTVLLTPSAPALVGVGANRAHQLDIPADLGEGGQLLGAGATWRTTYAWTRDGVWGTGARAPLPRTPSPGQPTDQGDGWVRFPGRRIERVACGSEHVLVLLHADGETGGGGETEVWAWGWNEHGTLGVGHTRDVDARAPVGVWREGGGERGRAVGVWAGCGTSWVAVERDGPGALG